MVPVQTFWQLCAPVSQPLPHFLLKTSTSIAGSRLARSESQKCLESARCPHSQWLVLTAPKTTGFALQGPSSNEAESGTPDIPMLGGLLLHICFPGPFTVPQGGLIKTTCSGSASGGARPTTSAQEDFKFVSSNNPAGLSRFSARNL